MHDFKDLPLRGRLALLFLDNTNEFYYKFINALPWYKRAGLVWKMLRLSAKKRRSEKLRDYRESVEEAFEEVDIFLKKCGHEDSKS